MTDEFAKLRKALLRAFDRPGTIDFPDIDIISDWQRIVEAVTEVKRWLEASDPFSQALPKFDTLQASLQTFLPLLRELETTCFRRRDAGEHVDDSSSTIDQSTRDGLNNIIHRCRLLLNPASSLHDWLLEPATRAARHRLYFLIGPAGSGKTHLLLDGVRSALDENRPAVLLHGAQFGGELWASICGQLGQEHLGKDILLGAMDTAAEAAGLDGGRFVIMVDALNETPVAGYWKVHLPVLRAAFAQWPNLALAVSCRDTYLEVVDPDSERDRFVLVTHPGFAGREIEATQKYFDHYGLEAPRIPLLTPEFSLPLFLRMYCESLRDGGGTGGALGHEGRIAIFERYLKSKIGLVAGKVFPNMGSNLEVTRNGERIRQALDSLLDAMASSDSEWLRLEEAEIAVASALGSDQSHTLRVIGAFENEGILSQEPLYLRQRGDGAAIRVTFQAFSDFLLLKRRLTRSTNPLEDELFQPWLRDTAGWGILEAATIVLPELHGVELPDFLEFVESDLSWNQDASHEVYKRRNRAMHVFRSLATMLPYRSSKAVTQRTVQLLNLGLQAPQPPFNLSDFFDILYTIAPQPDNPLNAFSLHRYLSRQSMPRRDASFGFAVYHELFNEASPISRLARWVALGPYPSYPPSVIELAADALIWLLFSPNRPMRDWVTKALVQLLHGHLDVMRSLIERFWAINDPYVTQRVVVIAYGSIMRGGESDRVTATAIATWVLDHVFARPMRPDELMLDAARGIVEWAVTYDSLPASALEATKRPYGLKPPGNPPTKHRLESKFDHSYKDKRPDSESYLTIWSSLFGMGDFGRYVVDSAMGHFLRYRHGQPVPEPAMREPRLVQTNWKKFIRSLTNDQRVEWGKMEAASASSSLATDWLFDESSPNRLTEEQRVLFDSAWTSPPPREDPGYPGDRAQRWIFRRTLSLGWTPQLFGERDRILRYRDSGRSEHKTERWGKKYQWMAFHELLARVADNYQAIEPYGEPQAYDGLQQLMGDREIDPSLPPIDYREFLENRGESTPTWRPAPLRLPMSLSSKLDFARFHGDVNLFVTDHESEPLPDKFVEFVDDSSERWIAIDGFEVQIERDDSSAPRFEQTLVLHSALVSQRTASRDARHLAQAWQERWYEFDSHGHVNCCYASEVGWSPRTCIYRDPEKRTIEAGGVSVEVVNTTVGYTWEGNVLDCSIGEAVLATMPSAFVLHYGRLKMRVEGPSWLEDSGRLVATYRNNHSYPWRGWRGLYVRVDWLRELLAIHSLALVLVSRFERRLLDEGLTYSHPYVDVWSSAVLRADGTLVPVGEPIRVEGESDD